MGGSGVCATVGQQSQKPRDVYGATNLALMSRTIAAPFATEHLPCRRQKTTQILYVFVVHLSHPFAAETTTRSAEP